MDRLAVKVVLDGAVGSYDKCYSYFVPEDLFERAVPGCRVTVPFGNGNIKKQGMIIERTTVPDDSKIKKILSVQDNEPILDEEMLMLCSFMKERLFCTYYDAVNVILPAGLKLRLEEFYTVNSGFSSVSDLKDEEKMYYDKISEEGTASLKDLKPLSENYRDILRSLLRKDAVIRSGESKRTVGDKTAKYARITDTAGDFSNLSERQREVAEVISVSGCASLKEIMYFTGCSVSVINSLEKKGIIELFEKQVFRLPYKIREKGIQTEIKLNEEQTEAYNSLKSKLNGEKGDVSLLYGVTGSGKTSVYMKLVDDCLKSGGGAIVMVPEIALTPQTVRLFGDRYGNKIAILHSDMSIGQRADEYSRLKSGRATIAIGTRSAVFAPVKNLKLIIIDEEQEHTYKSEKSPRFHTRDCSVQGKI